MPVSDRTTEERARARKALNALVKAPVTLARPVYFVPGWRDEHGNCWERMEQWFRSIVKNQATHVNFIEFVAPDGGPVPPWEDFLDFGDDLAELIQKDVGTTGGQVDIVCHSMGGLDTFSAIALQGDHPELAIPQLKCVNTVITYDTPFQGFGAASSNLFKDFVKSGRSDQWVLAQLMAMEKDSKRIAEVKAARDTFLGNVVAFWPRGADNFDGILEVPHDSASFGDASDFAPEFRARYHDYRSWPDTTHSGAANGVTFDLRAILETVQILTGAA